MNNLVPEKRLDKNNRLVTKHVRNGDTPWTAAPLPAPVVSGLSNLKRLRQEVDDAIRDHDESGLMDAGYERFFREGNALTEEDTALAIKAFVDSRQRAELAMHLVADFGKHQHYIREVIFYQDAMPLAQEPCDPGVNFTDEMVGQIRGVREMKEFENIDDLTKLPPERSRQVAALLRVGYAVYKDLGKDHPSLDPACKYGVGSGYPLTLKDETLIAFTKLHADRADAVAKLIGERKSLDLGWIEEALTISPSLTEGSL